MYMTDKTIVNRYNDMGFLWQHIGVSAGLTYDDLDLVKEDHDPDDLFYPPFDDHIPLEVYDEDVVRNVPLFGNSTGEKRVWTGSYWQKQMDGSYGGKKPEGVIHLTLPAVGQDGPVSGSGMDGLGDFTIAGFLRGSSLVYEVQYTSKYYASPRYQGTLNTERDEFEGVYGYLETPDNAFETQLQDSDIAGRFEHRIAAIRFSFLEPTAEELASSRPRALWRFAIDSVLNLVRIRAGHFSWPYLKDRRRVRKRFLELYRRLENQSSRLPDHTGALSTEEADELGSLVSICSPQDLCFYKQLSKVLQRREIVHW